MAAAIPLVSELHKIKVFPPSLPPPPCDYSVVPAPAHLLPMTKAAQRPWCSGVRPNFRVLARDREGWNLQLLERHGRFYSVLLRKGLRLVGRWTHSCPARTGIPTAVPAPERPRSVPGAQRRPSRPARPVPECHSLQAVYKLNPLSKAVKSH